MTMQTRRLLRLTFSLLLIFNLVLGSATGWTQPLRNPFDPSFFQNASIMEINYYLSQMDSDEMATTLKLLRSVQVVKGQYVGNTDGTALMTGSIKGMVNSLGDPYSILHGPQNVQ